MLHKNYFLACLLTTPSLFLSIFLKSFSKVVSSPINSFNFVNIYQWNIINSTSKLSRPSKSLSILLKNSSTSSLDVGIPLLLRTLCHSSGVNLPSPFLSARVNIFRIWKTKIFTFEGKKNIIWKHKVWIFEGKCQKNILFLIYQLNDVCIEKIPHTKWWWCCPY